MRLTRYFFSNEVKTAMKTLEASVLADGLTFGEGPRWHENKLWISDMHANRILTCDLSGNLEEITQVPGRPSGLGWLPDGRLLYVSMLDSSLYTFANGKSELYADLGPYCGGDPNDMVVDQQGRAYVGNFGYDMLAGEEARPADLVLVGLDQKPRIVASDLQFPNGTVITPDDSTLIIAETFGTKLTAFDIDPSTGDLSGRRTFADLGERTPDGICLDAEGCVWVSCFVNGEYVRVQEGGEITHLIDAGSHAAVACMLGGEDGRTLFLLTSDTDVERLTKGESACRVETVEAPAPSAGLP
jgi:sugar lactone lactonase YvrE